MKDTIDMGREAGIKHSVCEFYNEELKRFAALVRADEREACAKVCEDHFSSDGEWCAKAIRARVEDK
jgi:hypothetical protein